MNNRPETEKVETIANEVATNQINAPESASNLEEISSTEILSNESQVNTGGIQSNQVATTIAETQKNQAETSSAPTVDDNEQANNIAAEISKRHSGLVYHAIMAISKYDLQYEKKNAKKKEKQQGQATLRDEVMKDLLAALIIANSSIALDIIYQSRTTGVPAATIAAALVATWQKFAKFMANANGSCLIKTAATTQKPHVQEHVDTAIGGKKQERVEPLTARQKFAISALTVGLLAALDTSATNVFRTARQAAYKGIDINIKTLRDIIEFGRMGFFPKALQSAAYIGSFGFAQDLLAKPLGAVLPEAEHAIANSTARILGASVIASTVANAGGVVHTTQMNGANYINRTTESTIKVFLKIAKTKGLAGFLAGNRINIAGTALAFFTIANRDKIYSKFKGKNPAEETILRRREQAIEEAREMNRLEDQELNKEQNKEQDLFVRLGF